MNKFLLIVLIGSLIYVAEAIPITTRAIQTVQTGTRVTKTEKQEPTKTTTKTEKPKETKTTSKTTTKTLSPTIYQHNLLTMITLLI